MHAKKQGSLKLLLLAASSLGLLSGMPLAFSPALGAQAQSAPSTAWAVTIVLPPRVVASRPATLAVLCVDGRLAAGVTVELGEGRRVTTDQTGRAFFTAPSGGSLLAKASGASAAALVDPEPPAATQQATTVASVASLRDRFAICGAGLRGDANANRVTINDAPALVLAASPECLVVLPGPKAAPGPATISVSVPGTQWTAATTLVSLEFQSPNPPLLPGKKGLLAVLVRGSEERLRVVVENGTHGVLRFLQGDAQELVTSGGPRNSAEVKVQAIRSGDFSFHARLLPAPDAESARRYLEAAELLAPKDLQHGLKNLAKQLARHPRNSKKVQRKLEQILAATIPGDFRALLGAARAAL